MDFEDRVVAHAKRVEELKGVTQREEAAKTALILPFIRVLGYDVFDPKVVVPEFHAHFGEKKSEKVDYAINRDGETIMLVEAKSAEDPLNPNYAKQLQLYFNAVPSVKIGILTNGIVYKFFSDLERENIMDEKPFMVFDFLNIEKPLIPELKKLCNDCFDLEVALAAAQDLKYLNQLKKAIAKDFKEPPNDLVKYFARQVCDKQMTQHIVDTFRDKLRLAFEHHVNDIINARLKVAMQDNSFAGVEAALDSVSEPSASAGEDGGKASRDNRIVTTQEEWEAYYLVKSLLRDTVDPSRVAIRDAVSYCSVLLDDKNYKPVCRLHFNSKTVKYIEVFDENKKGTRHPINDLNDIFQFADQLKQTIKNYDSPN